MSLRGLLARNMRMLRAQRGLSQEALADLVGMDRTYVSSLERERYAATVDMVERLAQALQVEPLRLLTDIIDSTKAADDCS